MLCLAMLLGGMLVSRGAFAQEAERRARALVNQGAALCEAGKAERALPLFTEATTLDACARVRGWSFGWQGRALTACGRPSEALDSYRHALEQYDQAQRDAAAAKDDRKGAEVLRLRMRTLTRMLEIGVASEEARRCHRLAGEYEAVARNSVVMAPAEQHEFRMDLQAVNRLFGGMDRHYEDVTQAARAQYEQQAYEQALATLAPWANPPQAPAEATDLDAGEGFCLRAMCLCQQALTQADPAATTQLLSQAEDCMAAASACPEAQRAPAQALLVSAREHVGSGATLTRARQLLEQRQYAAAADALSQWRPGAAAPANATAQQALEGWNLAACACYGRATEVTSQQQFEQQLAAGDACRQSGLGGPGAQQAQQARTEALDNRYGAALRQGQQRFDAKDYQQCLAAIDLWADCTARPAGATELQNAEACHLRGLALCYQSLQVTEDAVADKMIADAKTFFAAAHILPRRQRDQIPPALAAALTRLGKDRFTRQVYDRAYLNFLEVYDLQGGAEMLLLQAECHRLDPASGKAYEGPAFLRDCIVVYGQLLERFPQSAEAKVAAQRLPEVTRRLNQTAFLQLEPAVWGAQAEDVNEAMRRCLSDTYSSWRVPERVEETPDRVAFLFDSQIDATEVREAVREARDRGNYWLLQCAAPETKPDAAGVITGLSFTVNLYRLDTPEGQLAGSATLSYQAKRTTARDAAGKCAADLLKQIRARFLTDLARELPACLGEATAAQ